MDSIDKLIQGYKTFYKDYFEIDTILYDKLASGQYPKAIVIACCDSRVDPAIITNSEPGDIFTIRNVANLVPAYQPNKNGYDGISAALEFGVKNLKIKDIIIIGHSQCAGIQALVDTGTQTHLPNEFIDKWVAIAQNAKNISINSDNIYNTCEKQGILLSLNNLMTFPWIKDKVDANELNLHGWHFSIEDGSLVKYNFKNDKFEKI